MIKGMASHLDLRKSIKSNFILNYEQKICTESLKPLKFIQYFVIIATRYRSLKFSIPLSVKTLNVSNFRKKIKSLLLNVLGNEDNYLNVNFLIEYFVKLT